MRIRRIMVAFVTAGALAVASAVLARGALHEDGLADLADALGVRGDAQAKLAAMRASGIGSFGTLALILASGITWWLAPLATTAIGFGFYALHNTFQTNATQMTPEARGTAVGR